MRKNTTLYKTLARALSIKRPHGGVGEGVMLDWIVDNLPSDAKYGFDAAGNLHIDARKTTTNRTLFVAHVDTVHREDGPNKIRKTRNKWYAHGSQLGADDGAGVAILMQLLTRGVAAYYLFTIGEECGGIGARHVAKEFEALLREFDRAIAFDRRGTDSVITHQGYGRCCSDAFAQSLSEALMEKSFDRLMYLPDDTGVYTDTAEFVDIIPECTNISVGYDFEHSTREELDINHFVTLANAVCHIDWDGLPTSRDPSVVEATSVSSSFGTGWQLYDDVHGKDWEREYLRDAIYDALVGRPDELIDMMCESVYPEDPLLAKRYINVNKLTDETLEHMLKQANTYDTDTVLCTLYDQIYTGV